MRRTRRIAALLSVGAVLALAACAPLKSGPPPSVSFGNAVGIGVACNGGDLYATEDFGR
jgi:hypothetical protein